MTSGAPDLKAVRPIEFKRAGPVADAYRTDLRFITNIMGPVGGGKTTENFKKIINIALMQGPGTDGVRRARCVAIRDTYPNLERSVMKSWFQWFPKGGPGEVRFSGATPITHVVRMDFGPLGVVELEMIFAAIGDHDIENFMRGFEPTIWFFNEVDTLPLLAFSLALTRTGRYPNGQWGKCTWSGVLSDMNAPDTDNWTYEKLVEGRLGLDEMTVQMLQEELGDHFGVGFHRQPPAMLRDAEGHLSVNPDAENLQNLENGRGYYAKALMGLAGDENMIRRMILNEFGAVQNGQPVYPEYKDEFHLGVAPPVAKQGLFLGVDGGLTPAAIIGQRTSLGQIRVLDEIAVQPQGNDKHLNQISAYEFGVRVGEHLLGQYPDNPLDTAYCDPATAADSGVGTNERSWMDWFKKGLATALGHSKFKVRIAPGGNGLEGRLQAVKQPLHRVVDGGQPGFLLASKCRWLRRGFNNGYVFQRVKVGEGDGHYKSEPLKNDYSHAHDALQYLCQGLSKAGRTRDDLDSVRAAKERRASARRHSPPVVRSYG
ncbi:hypothetical protein ACSMXM_01285 [Pacificimonas sp. ICDLI1SI03]